VTPAPAETTDQASDLGVEGLPRSIFVPIEDPRREVREAVYAILSDGFMAFLSILLIPILLVPFFVQVPDDINRILNLGDVTIIGFFVVEYGSKLYLAEDRWEYFLSGWHLLDLVVILLSFVAYLPLLGLSEHGSAVLLLRLLRLPRVFAVGGRAAASRFGQQEQGPTAAPPEPDAIIRFVDPTHLTAPQTLSWAEFEQHLATDAPEWFHVSRLSYTSFQRLSALVKVPERHFRFRQLDDLWPHVGRADRAIILFFQTGEIRYPKHTREFYTIGRRGAAALIIGPKIISITAHQTDPFSRVAEELGRMESPSSEFTFRILEAQLDSTVNGYHTLFTELELEINGISRTPRSRLPKDFLARAYELHKAITRVSANITHFRELLSRLVAGRVPIEGVDDKARGRLEALADEAGYLGEIARESSESLNTVIDVYINQSSYETNRILKILAVITTVAIIPATIGGLLGIDGPYSFVLWQVGLAVSVGMIFVGYCFIQLGWLKS
jgi:Mg2+ and Co2+ transporter CorA